MTERERLILIARAKQKQQAEAAAAAAPQTNLVEQVGTGTSEGIANMLGLPVDAMTGALNWMGAGIEQPFGGSESIRGLLDPFMSDVDPQTAGQRIGRRVGQDAGAGAVAAPVAGISTLGGMALNMGADAASGLAGGATAEVTDNPIANIVASLLAGGGVVSGSRAARPDGVPSIDELRAREAKLYGQVENSDFRLSPHQTQELQGNVSARMHDEGMYPPQHIGARGAVERFYEMPNRHPAGTPSLGDVEDVRQYVNQKVTPSQVPGEQELGMAMKNEIDAYLSKLEAQGGEGVEDIAAARQAHETSRRRISAQELEDVFQKAGWRAASTGLGGNDINAARQNVRRILEKPGGGYTPEQIAKMKEIVEGTTATNAARAVGGLSPQRGLGGLATLGGAGMGVQSGNPAWIAPPLIGMVAQAIGEHLTKKQVGDLSAMIRNGGPVSKSLTEGEQAVLNALLAIQAGQQLPQ